MTPELWASQRQTLLNVETSLATTTDDLMASLTGFRRAPWENRCSAGHCIHNGWGYIGPGWNPGSNSYVPSIFRTKDFIKAYKAIAPHNMENTIFNEMESFNGRLFRSPGFDGLPLQYGDDGVTSNIWSTETGAEPWVQDADVPPLPREVSRFHKDADEQYLYLLGGEAYNPAVPPSPVYHMRTDSWRRDKNGLWTQRNPSLFPLGLRSFATFNAGTSIIIVGGATEWGPNHEDVRTVSAQILRSDDGLQSVTSLGDGPFGPLYGMRSTVAWGHAIIAGGAYGDGGFSTQVSFSNRCWAAPLSSALAPADWFEIAPLPYAAEHAIMLTLSINGVDQIGYIDGYNNITNAGGGPVSGIHTLDILTGAWQARTDSDFWTA